jgi:hypothetical protein
MLTAPTQPLNFDERALAVWPLLAEWRDAKGIRRVESTRPFDVTQQGATFRLKRPPEIGQLMHLTMPAAVLGNRRGGGSDLGCLALVWAVSDALTEEDANGGPPQHSVSVLFVGQASSSAFVAAEGAAYAYAIDDGGLFRLQPRGPEPQNAAAYALPTDKRKESRLNMPVEVTIEAFDRYGNVTAREKTVTENISRRGALVPTTLLVAPDTTVRLTNAERSISLNAVVRARRVGQNGVARLHLHLPDAEWPLDGLH